MVRYDSRRLVCLKYEFIAKEHPHCSSIRWTMIQKLKSSAFKGFSNCKVVSTNTSKSFQMVATGRARITPSTDVTLMNRLQQTRRNPLVTARRAGNHGIGIEESGVVQLVASPVSYAKIATLRTRKVRSDWVKRFDVIFVSSKVSFPNESFVKENQSCCKRMKSDRMKRVC